MKKLIYSVLCYLLMLPFNGTVNGCEEEKSLLSTSWVPHQSNTSQAPPTIRPAKTEHINEIRKIPDSQPRFFIQQPHLLKGINSDACPSSPKPVSNATEVQ